MKKTILTAIAAFLLLTGPSKAWADEPEIDCVANPTDSFCQKARTADVMPVSDTDETNPLGDDQVYASFEECLRSNNEADCVLYAENEDVTEPIDEPTDASPEIIDEDAELEEESEPESWPMYLSLGALGVAVIVFIVLNLFSSKKKK